MASHLILLNASLTVSCLAFFGSFMGHWLCVCVCLAGVALDKGAKLNMVLPEVVFHRWLTGRKLVLLNTTPSAVTCTPSQASRVLDSTQANIVSAN